MYNSSFADNSATDFGGALAFRATSTGNTSLMIDSTLFSANEAVQGGAISVTGPTVSDKTGTVSVSRSYFTGNKARQSFNASSCVGGAIALLSYMDTSISSTRFGGNSADCNGQDDRGAAVAVLPQISDEKYLLLSVSNASFFSNFFGGYTGAIGGAIVAISAQISITGSNFTSHGPAQQGGALFIQSTNAATVTINSSRFEDNVVTISGGAVTLTGSKLVRPVFSCIACTFISNGIIQPLGTNALSYGGGIALTSPWEARIENSFFIDNTITNPFEAEFSAHGGAIGCRSLNGTSSIFSDLRISGSYFEANAVGPALAVGGSISALYVDGLSISNSVFRDSSATAFGGAITTVGSPLSIYDSIFSGNSAPCGGGAVRAENLNGNSSHSVTVVRSEFSTSSARFNANATDNAVECSAIRGSALSLLFFQDNFILNSTFLNNTVHWLGLDPPGKLNSGGGAIQLNSASTVLRATVSGCTFDGNRAFGLDGSGGALMAIFTNLTFTNNVVKNNFASLDGGGVLWAPGTESGTNSSFIFCWISF